MQISLFRVDRSIDRIKSDANFRARMLIEVRRMSVFVFKWFIRF